VDVRRKVTDPTDEEVALFRGFELRGEDLSKMDRYSNSDEIVRIALQRYPRDPEKLEGDQCFKDDLVIMLVNNEEGLHGQMFGVFVQVGESFFSSLGRRAVNEAYPDDEARRKRLYERLDLAVADYGEFRGSADWKKLAADWVAESSRTASS
jgi:hypothetical protein